MNFSVNNQEKVSIDSKINNVENKLSKVSAIPIIGTVVGCAKVLMGLTQSLAGLACSVIAIGPAMTSNDSSLLKYSWSHVKHGAGNITAGILESIPVVQTVLYFVRHFDAQSDATLSIDTGHKDKFMAYNSLEKQDIKIVSESDSEEAAKVNKIFAKSIDTNKDSLSKIKRIAQETIDEHNIKKAINTLAKKQ